MSEHGWTSSLFLGHWYSGSALAPAATQSITFFIAMHLLKKKIDQRAVLFYPKHTSWTHGAPWPIGIRNADGTISGRHEAAHTDCSCSLISQGAEI